MNRNILIIGSGAREHAVAKALARSASAPRLVCLGTHVNPGIKRLTEIYEIGNIKDADAVADFATRHKIDLAIVGPEAPLEQGVADRLWHDDIAVIGPRRALARIETSKRFARDLLSKYRVPGNPEYRSFTDMDGVADYLKTLNGQYVVKADGLAGGKGVKVAGDHLHHANEALQYCQTLIDKRQAFVIEQKMCGPEFSLISACDGKHSVHMPPIQDHKRAFVGDEGANTGGMGSYSAADHLLPFLTQDDIDAARHMNEATLAALRQETGESYVGFLYGGFMATANGVKLIEYNARLGDPEAVNLLGLLQSDFVEMCAAMAHGTLDRYDIAFKRQASVCKYLVPEGYPDRPVKNQIVDVSTVEHQDSLFFAAVDERDGKLYQTGSSTVAVLALADRIADAERQAEKIVTQIRGPLFHRPDIGTAALINRRIDSINRLRNTDYPLL